MGSQLDGKMVSWLKRIGPDKEPHLLTYGRQTYSSDPRFQLIHERPNNWKLQIKSTKKSDAGHYECQVSSDPPLIKYAFLDVVVPTKNIVNDHHLEVEDQISNDQGSSFELDQIYGSPQAKNQSK